MHRIVQHKLSSLLLVVVLFAAAFAYLNRENRKPLSVLMAAKVGKATLNENQVWVTFRQQSPRSWREFAAITSLTKKTDDITLTIPNCSDEVLRRALKLSNLKHLVIESSDFSERTIDFQRTPLESVSFLNCNLNNSNVLLPMGVKGIRVDGSFVNRLQIKSQDLGSIRYVHANFTIGNLLEYINQFSDDENVNFRVFGSMKLSSLTSAKNDSHFWICESQLDAIDYDRSRIDVYGREIVADQKKRLSTRLIREAVSLEMWMY